VDGTATCAARSFRTFWESPGTSPSSDCRLGLAEPVDDPPAIDQASVLDGLTRAETIAAVRGAVESLPPPYREVIVLCEFEELDYSTAAGVMQCPLGTVRSRLHRARALLTEKLVAARGLLERVKV
jgi:RNA polymerase sigma-70 factor (ECF subfamily)